MPLDQSQQAFREQIRNANLCSEQSITQQVTFLQASGIVNPSDGHALAKEEIKERKKYGLLDIAPYLRAE